MMTKRSRVAVLAFLMLLCLISVGVNLTIGPQRLVTGMLLRWRESRVIGRSLSYMFPGKPLARSARDVRLHIDSVTFSPSGALTLSAVIENHTPHAVLLASRLKASDFLPATPLLLWRRPTEFGVMEVDATVPAVFCEPQPLRIIASGESKKVAVDLGRAFSGSTYLPPIVDKTRPGCTTLRAVLLLKPEAGRGTKYILSDAVKVCIPEQPIGSQRAPRACPGARPI